MVWFQFQWFGLHRRVVMISNRCFAASGMPCPLMEFITFPTRLAPLMPVHLTTSAEGLDQLRPPAVHPPR